MIGFQFFVVTLDFSRLQLIGTYCFTEQIQYVKKTFYEIKTDTELSNGSTILSDSVLACVLIRNG